MSILDDLQNYYWHQRWQIEPGVFTPGHNDVDSLLEQVHLPQDLSGKRVLDIGAWNGCFSFECERRGAAEVVSIGPERESETGLAVLRDYLGSKIKYQLGSIYDLDPDVLGTFDVVLCFGVFYHLRYPMLGIDNVRRVCTHSLYLESACIDHDLTVGEGETVHRIDLDALDPVLKQVALLQFFEKDNLNRDHSNWFSPNLLCMQQILRSAGFDVQSAASLGVRLYISATVREGYPDFLSPSTGEGAYYEIFLKKLFGSRESWNIKRP